MSAFRMKPSSQRRGWLALSRDLVGLAGSYVAATPTRHHIADFAGVEAYVMFIGYPRSGHSLVGALLDAHPHAVVALEMGALKYIHAGFDRQRLFWLIRRNAEAAAVRGRSLQEYRYAVPGQWQGQAERIRVIGDKQAEGATLRLRARPWLLDRLREKVRVPVYLVHVARNPFDNIATMARRAAHVSGGMPDLHAAVARYFRLCETVMNMKERNGESVFDLHHEVLLAQPRQELARLCRWLGLDPAPDYLAACAGIVYDAPHWSRLEVNWPDGLRREVEQYMEMIPYLASYAFDTA